MAIELSEGQRKKYLNTKVYFAYGEAKIFIVFLVLLIVFKTKWILFLFLFTYLFAVYLRFQKEDIITFFKRKISNIHGKKYKIKRKTY